MTETEVVFYGKISLNFNSAPLNVLLFGEHTLEGSSSDIKMATVLILNQLMLMSLCRP
jgi:hypothetical protein